MGSGRVLIWVRCCLVWKLYYLLRGVVRRLTARMHAVCRGDSSWLQWCGPGRRTHSQLNALRNISTLGTP